MSMSSKKCGVLLCALFLIVLATPVRASMTDTERIAEAQRIAEALSSGTYEDARKLFDDKMLKAVTVGQLEDIWRDLTTQYGSFQGLGSKRTTRLEGYDVVEQVIRFEKSDFILRVVFSTNDLVAGLFVMPGTFETAK